VDITASQRNARFTPKADIRQRSVAFRSTCGQLMTAAPVAQTD